MLNLSVIIRLSSLTMQTVDNIVFHKKSPYISLHNHLAIERVREQQSCFTFETATADRRDKVWIVPIPYQTGATRTS